MRIVSENDVLLNKGHPSHREPLWNLEMLSTVANGDFLKEIATLDALSENEEEIIAILNYYSQMSCESLATAQAARQLMVECRQSQSSANQKLSNPDLHTGGAFDRLIYLLDRYLEFCHSISLSPWPIDQFKVSIWIKNDVILTANSTRMRPLRKTVRCYITSLESIRTKTRDLFKPHPSTLPLDAHLMKSNIILEILNSLSVERDNLAERLGGNQFLKGESDAISGSMSERDILLQKIRDSSGEAHAIEAMHTVKACRSGDFGTEHKPRGKTADPHIHTLLRYRNYCFLNKISMWPIDAPRVALWLKESVLVNDARNKNKKSSVSFRTVQVYLSRLEYARLKTEHLFSTFPNYAVSLYKCSEIVNILNSLNTCDKKKDDITNVCSRQGNIIESAEDKVPALSLSPTSVGDGSTNFLSANDPMTQGNPCKKRKANEDSGVPTFPKAKILKSTEENVPKAPYRLSEEPSDWRCTRRVALRDVNGRITPPIQLQSDINDVDEVMSHKSQPSRTPHTPTNPTVTIPSISEWFWPSPSEVKRTKGCIAFILCSEEDSDKSSLCESAFDLSTPLNSPVGQSKSSQKYCASPARFNYPTFGRLWNDHPHSNRNHL
ncbi:hypothetical protein O181_000533 [Austropuccinia psidii MF-1]|uniref:Uncharacterized protein n=1 Tax=Austropuccinia psidii MF-1 TaxID=1389203 RepID=A0A9Q3B8P7_9BASI|nr:hypothetical protein [Austropuccinia psidii MF-1]